MGADTQGESTSAKEEQIREQIRQKEKRPKVRKLRRHGKHPVLGGGDNWVILTKLKIELHPRQGSFVGIF